MGPSPMTCKKRRQTHTQREDRPVKTEAEIGVMQLQAKEAKDWWPSPEARKKQGLFPKIFRESMALTTPWFH